PVEDCLAHDLRKGFAGHVYHKLLLDELRAAGVAPARSGREVNADWSGVGGRLAVENLWQRRHGFANGVTGKERNRQARAMAEDAPERDLLLAREFVLRHVPALELPVNVLI